MKTRTRSNSVRRLLDAKDTSITLKTMRKAADPLNLELSLAVRKLPLAKLEKIADKYINTHDAVEAAKLETQFLEGYYGQPIHELHDQDPAG